MKNKAYQKSHQDQPCTYSSYECFGDVVGHHVRVAGCCGTGKKMSDAVVIPVCVFHHRLCDARQISTSNQLNEWMKYMLERLTQEHGQAIAVEKLGRLYFEALGGEK